MSNRPRTHVMKQLLADAREIRSSRYFVKRGAPLWPQHDFDAHPWAIAIFIDSTDIGQNAGERDSMTDAQLSFEMVTRIPAGEVPDINDEVMEELYDDAELILNRLQQAKDPDDPTHKTIFKLDRGVANAVEFHDPNFRVQGITVNFAVSF